MRIKSALKIYDGERSYPPETVVEWPNDRLLPIQLGANVRPADADSAPVVYLALRKQFAAQIAMLKAKLKLPSTKSEQAELIQRELARLEADIARVPQPETAQPPQPPAPEEGKTTGDDPLN